MSGGRSGQPPKVERNMVVMGRYRQGVSWASMSREFGIDPHQLRDIVKRNDADLVDLTRRRPNDESRGHA